jgi:hypothetical protein
MGTDVEKRLEKIRANPCNPWFKIPLPWRYNHPMPRPRPSHNPSSSKHLLPRSRPVSPTPVELPTGEAFRPEWIDFENGIRVGNLEPHERITQILKFHLETRFRTPFVTDRWGRGVYWQWICWLPRANRLAKPISSKINFSCAKLFITADRDNKIFKSGLQIERGYAAGPEAAQPWGLRDDFDWHRLVKQSRSNTPFDRELRRLVERESFIAAVIAEQATGGLIETPVTTTSSLRAALRKCSPRRWAGFQLYYPMPQSEVRGCTGYELIQSIRGVFDAVIPAMNCCMDVPLAS